jgi:hypothetical protein
MVSSHEAGFDLRGTLPLSQDLARWDSLCAERDGQTRSPPRGSRALQCCKRVVWVNLTYPIPTREPAIAGRGRQRTATYVISLESMAVNMGDPSGDANESGSSEWETTPKTSDASEGSQRGHSTRSAGKPCTWGRATPGEAASRHYAECEGLGSLANVSGTRTREVLSWGGRMR